MKLITTDLLFRTGHQGHIGGRPSGPEYEEKINDKLLGPVPEGRPDVPVIEELNRRNPFHGPILLERELAAKSKCEVIYGKETL